MLFIRFSAICIALIFPALKVPAQFIFQAMSMQTDTMQDTWVKALASDSLTSSFLISIKKQVPLHLHAMHAEHVYVLSGKGVMTLGEKQITITPGDFFFIPRNTPHALVVTESPVKILSIQSPRFDGKDRVLLEQKK